MIGEHNHRCPWLASDCLVVNYYLNNKECLDFLPNSYGPRAILLECDWLVIVRDSFGCFTRLYDPRAAYED